jgi:hypothetical protein
MKDYLGLIQTLLFGLHRFHKGPNHTGAVDTLKLVAQLHALVFSLDT